MKKNISLGVVFVVVLGLILFIIVGATNPFSRDQLATPGGISGTPNDTDIIQPLGSDIIVREGKEIKVHPSRVLVKFKPGATRNFHAQSGPIQQFKGDRDLYLVENPSGRSVETMLNFYGKNPNVKYVEPDYIYQLTAVPNDPLWSQQWDMEKVAAPAAWDMQTDASDVVVGIIDSGINFSHPDLQANLWTNPQDGSHGYDCNNQRPGGEDQNGHGTWMAGIIGGAGNNSVGMAGLNWRVKVLALKAGNGSSISGSSVIRCLDYAVDLKRSGINLRVISESFGGPTLSVASYDAFRRSAEAGIMHVAAAGNESRNTDLVPFYPASFSGLYNIPGLISVMATDRNDKKWDYSDWGLATVDIGASSGAVSTTVTGRRVLDCEFCDPSGYYPDAGGTSAATPHVAGVAAALFQKNPALTPAQARDIILDYASYDPVIDPLTQQSTTAGRLNFSKTLRNPLVNLPRLNGLPLLSTANVTATANSLVRLTATVSDSDNDQIRLTPFQTDNGPFSCIARSWLLGNGLSRLFPSTVENNGTFTAPAPAIPTVVNYMVSATDNRGGGVSAKSFVAIAPNPTPGLSPIGTLSVTPTVGPAGSEIVSTVTASDPEGGPVFWSLSYGWPYGTGDMGQCCASSSMAFSRRLNSNGVYRLRAYVIDQELNLVDTNSVVVRIGGAVGEPPVAEMTPDKISGPAPLTITFDTDGSYDPDGSIASRVVNCYPYRPLQVANSNKFTCTFVEPGPYRIHLSVKDNNSYSDLLERYITVLPSSISDDNEPPVVNIVTPLSGAAVSGKSYFVTVNASDNVAVMKSELYVDSEYYSGNNSASATFNYLFWDTTRFNNGPHTLMAKVYDQAGNVGVSAPRTVSVDNFVVITSPVSNTSSLISGLVPINVQAAEIVIGVQFKIDGVNLGTEDLTRPFSLAWDTAQFTDGIHNLAVIARDLANSLVTSPTVSVKVDNTFPVLRIDNPIEGATVSGAVPLTVYYSDANGVLQLLTYVDTAPFWSLAPTLISPNPITWLWDTTRFSNGPHTITVRALDWAGHITNVYVTVTVNNPINLPPVVNAGLDQTITLPSTATLTGTASDDGLPIGNLTTTWSKVSGPGTVTFGSPASLSTTVNFSTSGTYTLRLTAFDSALSTTDDVVVTVNPAVYTLTTLTAGAGSGTVTPAGTTTHNSGTVVTLITNPSTSSIFTGWTGDTDCIDGSVTMTANKTCTANFVLKTFILTTNAGVGCTITPGTTNVNYGDSQTFAVAPTTGYQIASVLVDGVNQGTIPIYTFTNVQANHTISANCSLLPIPDTTPPTITITSPSNNSAVARHSTVTIMANATDNVGVTQVRFYVNDSLKCTDAITLYTCAWKVGGKINTTYRLSAQASDLAGNIGYSMPVTVMTPGTISINLPPVVSAGPDQTITLPNTATLTGTATDDGLPSSTLATSWSKVSGPGNVTFTNTSVLTTTASFSMAGNYTLRLTAFDSALSTTDDVVVTVNPAVVTTYTITASAGVGGTITPSGSVSVLAGGSQTFTITPLSGYQISNVLVDDINQGAIIAYTFNNVQVNHTVSVTFNPITLDAKPSAPSNFTAVAVSPTQVNLAWTDNATNETGFRLWRFINFINGDTSPASWIASLGVDVTTYTDGTVSSDTSYQYAIQTFNAAGGSAFTYVSNVITPVSTTP